ncbi:MAG: hypothetical protein QM727_09350 [Niabella sp.]
MDDNNNKYISYSAGFFMLIALAFGGALLGGALAMGVISLFSGISLTAFVDNAFLSANAVRAICVSNMRFFVANALHCVTTKQ